MVSSSNPSPEAAAIERRKAEHLRIAAEEDIETSRAPGWDDVHLVHDALPATDAARIDLSARLLSHTLALPLVIAGMTGGHSGAERVNVTLAEAAARHGLGIGVGSQRAALRDPSLRRTYAVVRERAPKAFVIANVGISQLVAQDDGAPLGAKDIRTLVEMVGANAIALHLNYLEESVQPEGQTRATGLDTAIRRLVRHSVVPVIAKETGAGISGSVARRLRSLGVKAIDVGGVGGTSFAAIEALRAQDRGDTARARLGEVFRNWGVPSAVAIVGSARSWLPIIATGGVRSGLDAAKAAYTLFHRIGEPESARVRSRVVELGLKTRIDFQNAETDGKDELVRLGGSATPALWDGKALTVGEAAVARKLLTIEPEPGPEREDGW